MNQPKSDDRRVEIHESLSVAGGPRRAQQLRVAALEGIEKSQLPPEAQVVFHSTQSQFTFGGLLPPARLIEAERAALTYNLGSSYLGVADLKNHIELCDRGRGFFGIRERLDDFVERAYRLAMERLDEVRYLRNYVNQDRVELITQRMRVLLKDSGILEARACYVLSGFTPIATAILAPAAEVPLIADVLKSWMCRDGSALKSERELTSPPPAGLYRLRELCAEPPRLLRFDDLPVLVAPWESASNELRATPYGTYMGERCYYASDELRAAFEAVGVHREAEA